jgi:hypothetical protein
MIIGVIIHTLIALIFINDPEYSFLGFGIGVIVLVNILGMLLMAAKKTILGARIFMISSILMVPIGLIGALGARKVIDEKKKQEFYNN